MFSFFLNIFFFFLCSHHPCIFLVYTRPHSRRKFLFSRLKPHMGTSISPPMIHILFSYFLACHQTHIPKDVATPQAPQHWKKLLGQAVKDSRVDYELIINNRNVLEEYMAWLATHGPLTDRYSIRQEKKKICYYVNAYNAAVIYGVLQHWPIDSVSDVDAGWFYGENTGFFLGQQFVIDGDTTTLFHLEQDLILGQFQDPRLHAALNCASKGCPALRYWDTKNFDEELDQHWQKFIRSNTKKTDDGWSVSELFFWYRQDLVGWSHASNLCTYLAPYLIGDAHVWMNTHKQDCPISSFPYDWSLND